MALVRSFSDLFPRFTGHMIGQRSMDYALLLLMSDDRIYGTDDAGEANRIIRKILEYQDLEPGSATYGNFRFMAHLGPGQGLQCPVVPVYEPGVCVPDVSRQIAG